MPYSEEAVSENKCMICGRPASTYVCQLVGLTGEAQLNAWCAEHAPRDGMTADILAEALFNRLATLSAKRPLGPIGNVRFEFVLAGTATGIAAMENSLRSLPEFDEARTFRKFGETGEESFLVCGTGWEPTLATASNTAALASRILSICAAHRCRFIGQGVAVKWSPQSPDAGNGTGCAGKANEVQ